MQINSKPGALLNLAYRQQMFPRDAFRHMFDHLLAHQPERQACQTMVSLLLLAHERGCEAELACLLDAERAAGRLPDMAALRTRFAPDPASLPEIHVRQVPLADYQELLDQPGASAITPPSVPGQEQAA